MMIKGYNVKKRYIVGGLLALFVLVKCTGGDDEERQQYAQNIPIQSQQQPQPTQAPQQYDDVQQVQQPQYVAPAPQAGAPVTIVNTPSQSHDSNGGLLTGLMIGHMMGNNNSGGGYRDSGYSSNRSSTVNKKTVVNNHYYPTPVKPAPAPRRGPVTTYTSQPPAQPQYKTWSSSSRKGWGSATSTRSSGKPSFRYRSSRRR